MDNPETQNNIGDNIKNEDKQEKNTGIYVESRTQQKLQNIVF